MTPPSAAVEVSAANLERYGLDGAARARVERAVAAAIERELTASERDREVAGYQEPTAPAQWEVTLTLKWKF